MKTTESGEHRLAVLASLLVLLALLVATAAALASTSHTHMGTIDPSATPNGSFGSLSGVAVDQDSGDVYVVDRFGAPDSSGAVDVFDQAGAYQSQITGAATPQSQLALADPSDVAIDNSGGPSDGNVYVTDSEHNLLDAFDGGGALVASFGTAGQLDGSTTPAGSFSGPCGVAVDQSNGDVYLADRANDRIWVFDETGTYLDRIADSILNGPCGLALDSAGNLYVQNTATANVVKFDPSGDYLSTLDSSSATDVAVELTSDHAYVDNSSQISEYAPDGTLLSQFAQGEISGAGPLAIEEASGRIYVSQGSTLHVFGPAVTLPDVSTGTASEITPTTAKLSGTVDPDGGPEASCIFEYSTGQSKEGTFGHTVPCEPAGPFASPSEVTASLTGLTPATYYHYRIASTNANGTSFGETQVFLTVAPPAIDRTYAVNVSSSAADIKAAVDPQGFETTVHLEWGSEDCSVTACTPVPVPDAAIGSTDVPEPEIEKLKLDAPVVAQHLIDLLPDTTYHYRAVASNENGVTVGPDQTFHTRPIAVGSGLAPGRAYEMVSPVEKNGGDIGILRGRQRSSASGDAAVFSSATPFADAAGSNIASDYLAQRRPEGWTTHALTPDQPPIASGLPNLDNDTRYVGFSSDLSKGIILARAPLTADPNTQKAVNLYLRDNTLLGGPSPAGGANYELLSGQAPALIENSLLSTGAFVAFDDATPDMSHVVFESLNRLADGAENESPKLYEWDDGTVRSVGVLPDGTILPASLGGDGALRYQYTHNTISEDGSRIFFTDPSVGEVGTTDRTGDLYVRIDQETSILLNATEKTNGGGPDGVDAGGHQPGRFWTATPDGKTAVFTSEEQLTNEDENEDRDVYMWSQRSTDETQSVAVSATGGTFTIALGGLTTEPLPFDETAAGVQSALEALTTIGAGNVSVSGGPGDGAGSSPYEITFEGNLAGVNVREVNVDASGLTGGSESATVGTPEPISNLTLISKGSGGSGLQRSGFEDGGVLGVSDDGTYVYFSSSHRLLTGQTIGLGGVRRIVYVWHDDTLRVIGAARETSGDPFWGEPVASQGNEARVVPSGKHLLFTSRNSEPADLTGYDSRAENIGNFEKCFDDNGGGRCAEVYLYSYETDTLTCVSCNPTGALPLSNSEFERTRADITAAAGPTNYLNHPITNDGSTVFFTSGDSLVAQDTNGFDDVYQYDTASGALHLVSTGQCACNSVFVDATPDGSDVFFTTRQRLVRIDVDTNADLYDARIGGGIAAQNAPPPAQCQGDACQAPPSPPNDPTPASSSFQGAGNSVSKARRKRHKKHRGHRRHRHHRHATRRNG